MIANPVFDPAKKYKFLVYGNFDPEHTGTASIFGANEIKAWIKDWGGDTTDEVSGDLDFIVLGERPQLPPQPSGTAPLEVINFYLNQQKLASRYDELLKQAGDTSIPLLNENRLLHPHRALSPACDFHLWRPQVRCPCICRIPLPTAH